MANPLLRYSPYLIMALGFLCSLLFAAEVDLVAVAPVAEPRQQRLELEELLSLSGLFSIALAVIALFKAHLVTRERGHRTAAEHVANTDPLTGLSNRRRFLNDLQAALSSNRADHACALLLIDLDRFKAVNDTLGHAAGDALLVQIAQRLGRVASKSEHAARLGGDEFGLLLEGGNASEFGARTVVRRLLAEIGRPFEYDGTTIVPAGSVGMAIAEEASTVVALMEAADVDMYRAKHQRRRPVAA
jgi:diguanylate cyclase (GGDEF)-like protein